MTPSSQIRAKNSKAKQDQNTQAAIYSLCLECRLKEVDLDLLNVISEVSVIVEFDIYAHLLQACANLKAMEKGRQIQSLIIRNGIFPNDFLGTRHANMYAKCESLADARLSLEMSFHGI